MKPRNINTFDLALKLGKLKKRKKKPKKQKKIFVNFIIAKIISQQ